MNNIINVTEQLELGINGPRPTRPGRRQRTRIERAAWWFAKMRQAVDSTTDWQPKPLPAGEQLWIESTYRRIAA
jgi:hypothetical protein